MKGNAMATTKNERSTASPAAPFLKGLAEMPQLNTKMLTRANEIMSEAAKAIWASEVELVRIEAEEGSKLLFLAKPAGDPGKLAAETFTQWHNSSEKVLTQMRDMGDLMRKCGWELFELYSENMKVPAKSSEAE
jgi:hypothetical protein